MTDSAKEAFKLYKQKNYSGALAILLSLPSEEAGVDPDIAYLTGLCLARMERDEDAISCLEQVVTMNEDYARLYQCRLTLAVLYARTGRAGLADFELKKITELGYESAQVFSALGFVSYEAGDADKSIEWYEKAIALDKKNATALNGMGYVLAESGKDLQRALELCKQAFGRSPDNPAYLDSLAWVYHKLGLNKEARTYIKRAREMLPDNATVAEHFKAISGA